MRNNPVAGSQEGVANASETGGIKICQGGFSDIDDDDPDILPRIEVAELLSEGDIGIAVPIPFDFTDNRHAALLYTFNEQGFGNLEHLLLGLIRVKHIIIGVDDYIAHQIILCQHTVDDSPDP
ncbi:hypothetical protein D3C71_1720090 [compost metagenome]